MRPQKKNPLISVIIPCYNRARYIIEALKSVERQTYRPLEVIVVDDASQDGSVSAVRRHPWKIPVRVHSFKTNKGPAAARHWGVQHSHGEWLSFLDSDDLWHPQKLEKQMAVIRPEVGLVYCEAHEISRTGRILRRNIFHHCRFELRQSRIARRVWRLPFFPLTSTVLMSRWAIEKVGSFDLKYRYVADDMDLWMRALICLGAGGVRCIQKSLVYYRFHGTQLTGPIPKLSSQFDWSRFPHIDKIKGLDNLYFWGWKFRRFFKSIGYNPEKNVFSVKSNPKRAVK